MQFVALVASGLLFGIGLVLSGLGNPAKVQNFLDIAGTWDPSLAFTMGGAVITTAIGFRIVLGRSAPLFAGRFQLPTRSDIDPSLIAGAALFGIGWGLVGYCPGPAILALPVGGMATATFVTAMAAAMVIARLTVSNVIPTPPAGTQPSGSKTNANAKV